MSQARMRNEALSIYERRADLIRYSGAAKILGLVRP